MNGSPRRPARRRVAVALPTHRGESPTWFRAARAISSRRHMWPGQVSLTAGLSRRPPPSGCAPARARRSRSRSALSSGPLANRVASRALPAAVASAPRRRCGAVGPASPKAGLCPPWLMPVAEDASSAAPVSLVADARDRRAWTRRRRALCGGRAVQLRRRTSGGEPRARRQGRATLAPR